MKTMTGLKRLTGLAAATMIAVAALAVDNTITNYLPNYVQVPSSCTNAGDTGLTTGKVYMAFCLDDFTSITTNGSRVSGGPRRACPPQGHPLNPR